ncbi:MAG TPA: hypothetical protein VFF68_07180 [Anaerolineaceae bacterium]|nr:hypothetical protein [Anaerolineaceae bacterium]
MEIPRRILGKPWAFPLILLLTTAIAYGYLLPKMGFYWDDWMAVFLGRFQDAEIFTSYYAYDRPFSAWTYLLAVPVLGANPIPWQVLTITLRWLTAFGLWLALLGLWPNRKNLVSWMALLMVVYPGFLQQPISVAYSQHLTTYALFTLSLAAMVWAARRPQSTLPLLGASVLAAGLHMATMEYFVGLEVLRPVVLWFLLRRPDDSLRATASRVLRWWLPFLLLLGLFLVWRFIIFPSVSPFPEWNAPLWLDQFRQNPLPALFDLVRMAVLDVLHMLVYAWVDPLRPELLSFDRILFFAAGAGTVIAAALFYYLSRKSPEGSENSEGDPGFYRQAALIGAAAVLLGGLTYWITGTQAIVGLWSDRFTLAPMLGVVVLSVAAVDWVTRHPVRRNAVLSVLLAFGLAAQFLNTYTYRQNWKQQVDFYTELTWRAPALQEGTAVLTQHMPFDHNSEYGVAYATNVIYADAFTSNHVPYWFLSALNHRGSKIEDYAPGLGIHDEVRNMVFDGTTSRSVLFKYAPEDGCLRLLTEADRLAPDLSAGERDLLPISNPGQIIDTGAEHATLPADIFREELAQTWCYYYEKADLARQQGDWQRAAALWDAAQAGGFQPNNGMEYLPFIEAYGHLGHWDEAEGRTLEAAERTASMEPFLCERWLRLVEQAPASTEADEAFGRVRPALGCPG